MKITTKRAETSAPLSVRMYARYCFESPIDWQAFRKQLAVVDRVAAGIVSQPISDDAGDALPVRAADLLTRAVLRDAQPVTRRALEFYFESGQEPCVTPGSAAQEVSDALVWPVLDVGFLLGLCVAHRLAVESSGKDGVQ